MARQHWYFRDDVVGIAALVLLPAVFAVSFLISGRIPLDTSSIFLEAPWEDSRPDPSGPLRDPLLERQAKIHYPELQFLHESYKNGDSLLWQPREFGGVPFMSTWRSRCLSLFSIPFIFLAIDNALLLSVALKLFIAGLTAYYASRRIGLFGPIALITAVSYQFSGALFLHLGFPVSDVLPWMPLFFLFAERMALGQAMYWPQGAFLFAVFLLGGDPRTVPAVLFFFLLYTWLRQLAHRELIPIRRAVTGWAMAIGIGTALSAIQLVPYIQLVFNAEIDPPPLRVHTSLSTLATLWLPGVFGSNASEASVLDLPTAHLGLVPSLLIALWIAVRPFAPEGQQHRIDMLAGLSVVYLLVLVVAGPLLRFLPYFGRAGMEHFVAPVVFGLAIGGAAAAQAWLQLNPEQCVRSLKRLAVILPAFAALILGALLVGVWLVSAPTGAWLAPTAYAAATGLLACALLGITLLQPSYRLLGYGLSAISAAHLLLALSPLLPTTPQSNVFPETDFIRKIKPETIRMGGGPELNHWPLTVHGISQAYGSGGVRTQEYAAFLGTAQTYPAASRLAGWQPLALTKDSLSSTFKWERPNLRRQSIHPRALGIYWQLTPVGRCWLFPQTVSEASSGNGATMNAENLTQAILERGPDAMGGRPLPIQHQSNARITIDTSDQPGGLLVLADAMYPGWKARVDGVPTPIDRVLHTFRAVHVPADAEHVEFIYAPGAVRIGLAFTGAAGIIWAVGLGILLIHRIRMARHRY